MREAIESQRILGRFQNASAAVLGLPWLIYASQVSADPAITTGSTNDALEYYRKEEKLFPGLKLTNGVTRLDDVAAFLGYHRKTTATAEVVSSYPGETRHWSQKCRRNTSHAGEKTGGGLKT
jgi:hypothetical protein